MNAANRIVIIKRPMFSCLSSFFEFTIGTLQALREDPDVILVSELRDLSAIRTAIVAAETGHLVLATLP